MRYGSTRNRQDPEAPHCSTTHLYDPLVNSQADDTTDTEDETYCERRPLLNGVARSKSVPPKPLSRSGRGLYSGLNRSISVPLSRSNSIPSVSDGDTSGATSSSDESTSKLTTAQKKTLAVTAIADLLAYLSLSIMAPFFPEEAGLCRTCTETTLLVFPRDGSFDKQAALEKGVSDTLSGWIFGTQPFVQFLVSPICGKLLPYAGVKFTFIAGQFMSGGCTVLFGLLTYIDTDQTGDSGYIYFVTFSFVLQIFKSLGTCATSTASFVLLAEEFDNIATVFGIGEVFVGLGLVVGPAIGGVLYGQGGFLLPFAVIGGLSLTVIPFMWWIVPTETMYVDSGSEKIPFSKVLCSPSAIVTSLAIIISTFSWSILDPTLEPHLRQFELSPELVGVIFLVMAAAYAVSSPIWGWAADKLTEMRGLLIGGFLIACVGSLLIGPSPLIGFDDTFYELWLIILALVILGASISLSSIPTFNQFFIIFEDLGFEDDTRTYSLVAGLWMSMYSLGDFLGPSVGGFLLDNVGFNNMCNYTAGLCLAMAILIAVTWILDLCCRKKIDKDKTIEKDIEQIVDSFANYKCMEQPGVNELTG